MQENSRRIWSNERHFLFNVTVIGLRTKGHNVFFKKCFGMLFRPTVQFGNGLRWEAKKFCNVYALSFGCWMY